jgi:hypothetical protein
MKRTTACILFALLCVIVEAQTTDFALRIEQLMTPQELKETGVSGLTDTQRHALNVWLNRYSRNLLQLATRNATEVPSPPTVQSKCSPAVESTLAGDFEGWSGETIFKLDNGQIWEQAEYAYTYSYSYRPEVTIYQVRGGCRMKVEDEDETILVRRIK